MPPKTSLPPLEYPKKLFYKINEVSSIVGVEAYVLRYWETKFSMLAPEKDENDQRRYRQKDIELVLKIKRLLYEEKYTIAGAVEILKKKRGGKRKQTAQGGNPEPCETPETDACDAESQEDEEPHVILIVEDAASESKPPGDGGTDPEALRTFQTRVGTVRKTVKRLIADAKHWRSTVETSAR